jgi:hypothetical protein
MKASLVSDLEGELPSDVRVEAASRIENISYYADRFCRLDFAGPACNSMRVRWYSVLSNTLRTVKFGPKPS